MTFTETQAKIDGDVDHFVKVGGTLRLSCRVYLGHQGPDDVYAKTAVIHWFHDQRLLDPDLENWKSVLNAIIINLIYNYKCTFQPLALKPSI